jgi:hypothetical protein
MCRSKHDAERFYAKPIVPWDGEYPLSDYCDKYFFDEGGLAEYIDDMIAEGVELESIRLVPCDRHTPRHFDVNEFLCDDLGEDGDVDGSDIEPIVNEWIKKNAPQLWHPKEKCRLDPVAVAKSLNINPQNNQ